MNRNTSRFTQNEMIDMIGVLASNHYQLRPSQRLYLDRYPERRQPSLHMLKKVSVRFRATGSVTYKKREVLNKLVLNEENELRVLLTVTENRVQSYSDISKNSEVCRTSTQRILKKHNFKPFRIS